MCGYRALLYIKYGDGRRDYVWSSTRSGCSTGYAWFDFNTNFEVPKGTRMCGSFFQNNQIDKSDGTACRNVSRQSLGGTTGCGGASERLWKLASDSACRFCRRGFVLSVFCGDCLDLTN